MAPTQALVSSMRGSTAGGSRLGAPARWKSWQMKNKKVYHSVASCFNQDHQVYIEQHACMLWILSVTMGICLLPLSATQEGDHTP